MIANVMIPTASLQDESEVEVATVFVIDPDSTTEKTVKELLAGSRLNVQSFTCARDFFAAYRPGEPGCLVLEQRIFDTSGLQIQRRLAEQEHCLPQIYVTSSIDVSTAVILMRGGAVHVLEKPLRSMELFNAIQEALALGERQRREAVEKSQVCESIAKLTHKERQLVGLLAAAKSTKAIAAELSISSRAVELRRHGVMRKLGLNSSLELVRLAVLGHEKFGRIFEGSKSEARGGSAMRTARSRA